MSKSIGGAFYPDLKIGVWRRRTYQTKFDLVKRSPEVDYLIFSLKIISRRYIATSDCNIRVDNFLPFVLSFKTPGLRARFLYPGKKHSLSLGRDVAP
jgi:hypothetical protein